MKYLNPIIVIVILGTAAGLFITYRIRKALKEDNTNETVRTQRRNTKYEEDMESYNENEEDEDCSDLEGNVTVESACAVEEVDDVCHGIDNDYDEEAQIEEELIEGSQSNKVRHIHEDDDFEDENI